MFRATSLTLLAIVIWCSAPSRNYFCAIKIAESKKVIFLFPLVEMLLSMKGTKPQEGFFIGSKLMEIFIFGQVNLAKTFLILQILPYMAAYTSKKSLFVIHWPAEKTFYVTIMTRKLLIVHFLCISHELEYTQIFPELFSIFGWAAANLAAVQTLLCLSELHHTPATGSLIQMTKLLSVTSSGERRSADLEGSRRTWRPHPIHTYGDWWSGSAVLALSANDRGRKQITYDHTCRIA